MMDFQELVESKGILYRELAAWCHLSVQQMYNYAGGKVNPKNLSYCAVTDMATYLGVEPDVLYNALCESFERQHVWNDELQRWE